MCIAGSDIKENRSFNSHQSFKTDLRIVRRTSVPKMFCAQYWFPVCYQLISIMGALASDFLRCTCVQNGIAVRLTYK